MMLYSGTSYWSVVATNSALGLLLAIGVKSMVFIWKSDFKTFRAVIYMLLANMYSTLPGILLTVAFAAPMIILITPLIYIIPARNMVWFKPFERFNVIIIALILAALTFVTLLLWGAAWGLQDTSLSAYWAIKFVYSSIAIGISFVITIACEESVISYLYERKYNQKRSFMEPVFWANAAVFILVVGIAAAVAIPKRLTSPDYLIYLIKSLHVG